MNSRTPTDFTIGHVTEWLNRRPFSRFVTLSLNQAGDGRPASMEKTRAYMAERLYNFDARMNKILVGKHYYRHNDTRMFSFFAPEKVRENPHWHGLVEFYGATGEVRTTQEMKFDENADRIWKTLVPSGTTDVQPITSLPEGIKYVAKSLSYDVNWDYCVFPDQYWIHKLH